MYVISDSFSNLVFLNCVKRVLKNCVNNMGGMILVIIECEMVIR